jgi:hypothetical protein
MTHLQSLQRKMSKTKKKLFDNGLLSFAICLPLFTLSALLIVSLRFFEDAGSYGYVRGELPLLSPALDSMMQEKYTSAVKMPSTTLAIEQTPTTLSIGSLKEIGTKGKNKWLTVPYSENSLAEALQRLLPKAGLPAESQRLIVFVPSPDRPMKEIVQLMAQLHHVHHYAHILLAHHAPEGEGVAP